MSKIYTKTGDGGESGLFSGERVPKDHLRLETYGVLDELGALIGLVRCKNTNLYIEQLCSRLQTLLFIVSTDLATVGDQKEVQRVTEKHVKYVELCIDQITPQLPPMKSFILSSGCEASVLFHLARTICRKAERKLAALMRLENVGAAIPALLNRMSDYLFVLARFANVKAGRPDEALNWDFPELKAL